VIITVTNFSLAEVYEVRFESSEYTVLEGDRSVSVCVEVSGGPLPEPVEVNIASAQNSLETNPAEGQLQFLLVNFCHFNLVCCTNERRQVDSSVTPIEGLSIPFLSLSEL